MLQPGLQIRQLRRGRGMGQAELARLAGLAQSNLSHIEKGSRDLTVSTLARIASALGVSAASLLEEPSRCRDEWSRERLERLARAVLDPHAARTAEMKHTAGLVRTVMAAGPRESSQAVTDAWLALRSRFTEAEIRGICERVRDEERRRA